jgi:hypothetical protein
VAIPTELYRLLMLAQQLHKCIRSCHPYVCECEPYIYRSDASDLRNSNKIPQCQFIEGCQESGTVLNQQLVVRWSREPSTARYSDPTNIITGIACVPVDAETQSPEAEVIEGGVNYSHVTIRLSPVESGKWACDITIRGTASTANVDGKVTDRQVVDV